MNLHLSGGQSSLDMNQACSWSNAAAPVQSQLPASKSHCSQALLQVYPMPCIPCPSPSASNSATQALGCTVLLDQVGWNAKQ